MTSPLWLSLPTHSTAPLPQVCAMLGDLAEAAGNGTTLPSIARHVTEALAKHVPLQRFGLGWCESSSRAEIALVDPSRAPAQVTQSTRPLFNTLARKALRARKPCLWSREESETGPQDEIQSALSLGSAQLFVLPLFSDQDREGFAAIYLGEKKSLLSVEAHAALVGITKILQGAQHNAHLLHRVAQVSRHAHREYRKLKRQLETFHDTDEFIALSSKTRQVLAQADRVAAHDTTALLLGESGTGKELLARRIHQRSGRASGPFIQVNCGALPEGLTETELFGHERGAFTGAERLHKGRFERAHEGTILLDEVADLPPQAQVKLLRVLQEGQLERVGGETPISINVRVIAATHKPLAKLVEEGSFRADLFYRLHVFPLDIPPLRDRRSEIPELARRILEKLARRFQRRAPKLTQPALRLLMMWSWPGNVRELENTLERALILTPGEALMPCALPMELRRSALSTSEEPRVLEEPALQTFEEAMRGCIRRALAQSEGKVYGPGGAAELLDLKPSTLQSKMKRLGMK